MGVGFTHFAKALGLRGGAFGGEHGERLLTANAHGGLSFRIRRMARAAGEERDSFPRKCDAVLKLYLYDYE